MAGALRGPSHQGLHAQGFHGMKELGKMLVPKIVNREDGLCFGKRRLHILAVKNIRLLFGQQTGKNGANSWDGIFRNLGKREAVVKLAITESGGIRTEKTIKILALV